MQTKSIEYVRELLDKEDYTLVLCNGQGTITSQKRGIAPLLELYDKGVSLSTYSCADKVVGKGAAFLYALLEAKELFSRIISENALKILELYEISVTYGTLVPYIINRRGDGMCPMEKAVLNIDSPSVALSAIREKYEELNTK